METAMARIDKELTSDEQVILRMRPHWVLLMKPLLVLAGLTVTFFYAHKGLVSGLPHRSPIIDKIVLGTYVVLLIAWTVIPFLKWVTTKYIFTDKRIITRVGIIKIEGETIPLNRINNLTYTRSLMERLYGAGSLVIEAAAKNEIIIQHIRGVEKVEKQIYEHMGPRDSERD